MCLALTSLRRALDPASLGAMVRLPDATMLQLSSQDSLSWCRAALAGLSVTEGRLMTVKDSAAV